MSDTTELLSDVTGTTPAAGDTPARPAAKPRRRSGTGLSAMVLPELQAIASGLGISGTGRMRKSQLIAAIQEKQGVSAEGAPASTTVKETQAAPAVTAEPVAERPTRTRRERSRPAAPAAPAAPPAEQAPPPAEPVAAAVVAEPVVEQQPVVETAPAEGRPERGESRRERRARNGERGERGERTRDRGDRGERG
ncbi:Rho termination factor N-terminal domain-containing protein, partial [Streptosporangium fragile]|uniref:Rho termination factor N-terminal domain-containing protein n=1 Tax=Streptosporangium fragile TaxID=46186 RepID=UPI0031EC55E6